MKDTLPREWVAALDNVCDLVTDPEAHAAKLVKMAFEYRRRGLVCDFQLSDMLEFADAARLYGLAEHEDWYAVGIFKYYEPEPDHYVHEILRKGKAR
ncbi:hypothetical protein A9L43_16085 [Pseudomonas mosselii]|uniref:hypothetical protein n=1 Tax=Pseudomonas TaxID=286 RepID=UPI00083D701D|nr:MULTISPECIES: hypothetical protein [Pseudomonas]ODB39621.1 hypothetical protein A9L43_16085 [Pseudomonas mosselii]